MTSRPALCDDPAAIDADWMQRALAAGRAFYQPIRGVVVEDLGSATNAFGRLLRCHLTTDGGIAAEPATVIVKLPTADRRAFRFDRRRGEREALAEYHEIVCRLGAGAGARAGRGGGPGRGGVPAPRPRPDRCEWVSILWRGSYKAYRVWKTGGDG